VLSRHGGVPSSLHLARQISPHAFSAPGSPSRYLRLGHVLPLGSRHPVSLSRRGDECLPDCSGNADGGRSCTGSPSLLPARPWPFRDPSLPDPPFLVSPAALTQGRAHLRLHRWSVPPTYRTGQIIPSAHTPALHTPAVRNAL